MSHNITALIIRGEYNKDVAKDYDFKGITLEQNFHLFQINTYYTTYWQHALELQRHLSISPPNDLLIPTEEVIAYLIAEITFPQQEYAVIHTHYFGGIGSQYAAILQGRNCVSDKIDTINGVLHYLGVELRDGLDEFDSIGLSQYRNDPPYLEKYYDLCTEMGL